MCKYCEELNEEQEDARVEEICLNLSGYFLYSAPIIYCPNCGKILDKYNGDYDRADWFRNHV